MPQGPLPSVVKSLVATSCAFRRLPLDTSLAFWFQCFNSAAAATVLQVRHVDVPSVGDTVTFQLLRRPKDKIIPEPVGPLTTLGDTANELNSSNSSSGAADPGSAGGGGGNGGMNLGSNPTPPAAASTSSWGKHGRHHRQQQQHNSDGASAGGAASSRTEKGAAAAAAFGARLTNPLAKNPFSKYATTDNAGAFFAPAATQLGQLLAQVMGEGGMEAEFEAPGLFSAMDSLADRARRFAERRGNQLEQRGLLGKGVPAPIAAGAAADGQIRALFDQAVAAAKDGGQHGQQQQQQGLTVADEFPELTAAARGSVKQGTLVDVDAAVAANSSSRNSKGGAGSGSYIKKGRSGERVGGDEQQQHRQEEEEGDEAAGGVVDGSAGGSPRAELHFDHAFSEDEEQEQQQQQDSSQKQQEQGRGETLAEAADAAAGGGGGGSPPPNTLMGGSRSLEDATVLGSSPGAAAMVSAAAGPGGDYYFYQAADGQWLYLHPLNVRCLLAHYGSYAACPTTIHAKILEIEDFMQTEISRKRWKWVSHLPLLGGFRLMEGAIDPEVLPKEALAAFAEELGGREKRRTRREAAVRREEAREAAAAAAAAAVKQGPTASELRAMPQLRAGGEGGEDLAAAGDGGLEGGDLEDAMLARALHDSAVVAGGDGGGSGVSFAKITQLGFAATGPELKGAAATAGGGGASGIGATGGVGGGGGGGVTGVGVGVVSPQPGSSPSLLGAWGAAAESKQSAAAKLSGGVGSQQKGSVGGAAWGSGGGEGGASSSTGSNSRVGGWGAGAKKGEQGLDGVGKPGGGGGSGAAGAEEGASKWLVLSKDGGAKGAAGAAGGGVGGGGGGTAQAGGNGEQETGGNAGGKKAGKKGVMLFSTTNQRRY